MMLTVQNLSKSFQGREVVKGVSFRLKPYTATALIGPNGAGKTTILSMIAGLLKPDRGEIALQGARDLRREIGFLPQYPKFFEALTAKEVLELCGHISGMQASEIRTRTEEVLDIVGLKDMMNAKAANFSGGMKQRLGIAQAILHQPRLLLLDEPVSALDPAGRREMLDLLKQLQQETTILYSTHILNDAEEMTDEVLFLQDGVLVERGSLEEVKRRYADDAVHIHVETPEQAEAFAAFAPFAVQVEGAKIIIKREDGGPAMRDILQYASSLPFEVSKIEKQAASLEHIFMKVAKRS